MEGYEDTVQFNSLTKRTQRKRKLEDQKPESDQTADFLERILKTKQLKV